MRDTWNRSVTLSYFQNRTLIGILGISLPILDLIAVMLGGTELKGTISHYYYSNMRDVLTGVLFVTGCFLICYIGPRALDFIVTSLAGFSALGIALFPCKEREGAMAPVGTFLFPSGISDNFHVACAAAFFVLIAVNAFLFLRRDRGKPAVKPWKRALYITCGTLIIVCLAGLLVCMRLKDPYLNGVLKLRFILESVALAAFSLSWFAKGDTIRRIVEMSRKIRGPSPE
jgi:hypothetical protein